ncbi:MAG: uracil-DNA glycosylase [Eubacteriales bacterium]|nr:uracil-DNA glycosylase [Eubacteriales bacterium]
MGLEELYSAERGRLSALIEKNDGDYASPVFGEGPYSARLMLIGEAPGREEAEAGRPFVGKAGRQLNELLNKASINRQDVFVTNAVKFRPVRRREKNTANRTPAAKELEAGLPLLKSEIALIKPKVIATLGNSPLSSIAKLAQSDIGKIGSVHGKAIDIIIEGERITLFPLYHPASGIYNRSLIETMERDIEALGAIMYNGAGV